MHLKLKKINFEMIQIDLKLLILFVTTFVLGGVWGAEQTDYTRLRNDLKSGYDINARPVQHHQNTTNVQLSLHLCSFEFDEKRSVFTLYAWAVIFWQDYHLKWDPLQYGNISHVRFAPNEVWQPDLEVYNDLGSNVNQFKGTFLYVTNSGDLWWIPPTVFKVGCRADMRKWPYDSHTCRIVVGSWTHNGEEIDLTVPNDTMGFDADLWVQNPEWDLVSYSLERRVIYYSCCSEPYHDVEIKINIRRQSANHSAAVILPALAITIIILTSFWLRPGTTERLALIIAVIVINSIYLYNVFKMIPNNGGQVPLVLLFYRDSLLMVTAALVWTLSLRHLAAAKRMSAVPLPGFIQTFLDSPISKILCLDPRPSHVQCDQPESLSTDDEKLVGTTNPYQQDWAWLAHLLDRFAFFIYLIIYIIFASALL